MTDGERLKRSTSPKIVFVQEMFGEELEMFARKETERDVSFYFYFPS